jgi:hypothetical protein|tara:strand:+ start:117 stop:404 length:288 start_codon:yes stop_codon:yes gene_type:complete
MNKNAREKELLEEAYASLYERRNPDADTYDAEGELPGPIAELDPDIEDEEGGCPNLDKLIGLAAALPQEDAEGREDIDITDEKEAAEFVDEDTPL